MLLNWLTLKHIRPVFKTFFEKRLGDPKNAVKMLIDAVGAQALLNKLVFSYDFKGDDNGPEEAADRIQKAVLQSQDAILSLFGRYDKKDSPAEMKHFFTISYHLQIHCTRPHLDFGGTANVDCPVFEKTHGRVRSMLKNIIGVHPEVLHFLFNCICK